MKLLNEICYSMVTRDGFVDVFWRELGARRTEDPNVTQRQVYQALDEIYFGEFKAHQFPSYEAFRKYRDSGYKKKRK